MNKPLNYKRTDGFKFVWNGSKTVNIYTPNGANVDVFSLDYSKDYTMREVVSLCDSWELNLC